MRWLVAFVLMSVVGVGAYALYTQASQANTAATIIIQNHNENKILLITLQGTAHLGGLRVPTGYAAEAIVDTQGQIVGSWQNLRPIPPAMLQVLQSSASSPSHYQLKNASAEEMTKLAAFIAAHRHPSQAQPLISPLPADIFSLRPPQDGAVISRPPVSQPLQFSTTTEAGLPISAPPFMVLPATEGE